MMKAVTYERYGSPEVIQIQEVDKPTPTADQVLVKIHAASLNAKDWRLMRAKPFLVRLSMGLLKPNDTMLGADLAGVVEAVGDNVTEFQPGDEVFGVAASGAFAEYKALPEKQLAHKPANVTFAEAAAVPLAGTTALQGLRDHAQVQPGQQVLINGASGGVGTLAVQIAKALGAEVTGVCSTPKVEITRSLGADHVIDYTKEDFTAQGKQYDVILDVVGNRTARDLAKALKPTGKSVTIGFTTLGSMLIQGRMMSSRLSEEGGKQLGVMPTARLNKADLTALAELLEAGHITPFIDRTYTLDEAADALAYIEKGRARGKIIIDLGA